jgi:adenylylsulfate kinase
MENKWFVLWLTWLSWSWKTTIAENVIPKLKESWMSVEYLDWDIVRNRLSKDLWFTKEDRSMNLDRISFVAELLSRNKIAVICAFVSPYREDREKIKNNVTNFIEVYVNAPIEICEDRDVKWLYKRARSWEIKNFTGISDPYEEPLEPDIECFTNIESVEESVEKVMSFLNDNIFENLGIEEQLFELITKNLSKLYWISTKKIELLWESESMVFKIQTHWDEFIIRLTWFDHRNIKEIQAELNFIKILKEWWAWVAWIIPTSEWELFRKIKFNFREYYFTVFEYVTGEVLWKESKLWSKEIFVLWGKTIWIIHDITINNKDLDNKNRLQLFEETNFIKTEWLLEDDIDKAQIIENLNLIQSNLWVLNIKEVPYWIIHSDMKMKNFHYSNWNITYFDFDDAIHFWFVYDIAVSAFHATEIYDTIQERTGFLEIFLSNIIDGYSQAKNITKIEILKILDLIQLRCFYIFIDYYKRLKLKHKDEWINKKETRRNYILDFNNFVDISKIEITLLNLSNIYGK